MKILDRLAGAGTGSAAGAAAGTSDASAAAPVRTKTMSFQSRMRRLAGVRSASWRQLLRVNREAQVDPLLRPPAAPSGFSPTDPATERNLMRRLLDNRHDRTEPEAAVNDGSGRRQAVEDMLTVLREQQRTQDALAARGAAAAIRR